MLTEAQRRQRLSRRVLAARGLVEAVTWSFIPPEQAKLFGGGQAELTLSNPISTELAQMRPVAPAGAGHRRAAKSRQRLCRRRPVRAWASLSGRSLPRISSSSVAGVRFGRSALIGSGRYWSGEAPDADVFAAKADAVAALAALGIDQASLTVTREAPSWFHPGRSGTLKLGPKTLLGAFGEFHPDLLEKLRIDPPIAGFELYLDNVPPSKRKGAGKALEASDLQPVRRDFAFLLGGEIEAGDVLRAALGADRGADRRGARVRRVYRPGRAGGQKVARHRGDAAAARQDADRRRDRGGGGEDRRRGHQGHRRRVARLAA